MKPLLNGRAISTLSDTVTLTAGTTPDASHSSFVVSPRSIAADNTELSTLTMSVSDANGNPISGIGSTLSIDVKNSQNAAPAPGKVTISSLTETATAGVYTAFLKGTLADTYTLKPQANGSNIGSLSDSVTLTADTTPDSERSSFSAAPNTIEADNSATSTLILSVRDSYGNAVSGLASNLSLEVKDAQGQAPAVGKITTSSVAEIATPGTYTATLKGTLSLIHI